MDVLGASNSSLRAEAYKQLLKLGVGNKFLRPDDVENVLIENGILERIEAPASCSDHMSSPESSQDLEYLSPRPAGNGSVDSQTSADVIFPRSSKEDCGRRLNFQVKKSVDLDVLVKGRTTVTIITSATVN
jgi:hypothetical protein